MTDKTDELPETFNDLTQIITSALNDLLSNDGWELPIHMVALGVNGAIVGCSYMKNNQGTVEAEITAEHVPGGNIVLPVTIVYWNALGDAKRMMIEKRDSSPKWIN